MKTAHCLQEKILDFIRGGDGEFEALALDVFAFQFEHNLAYRAYCQRLGASPSSVTHWTEIPAVPTDAFKHLTLTCFPPEEAVAEFHTSGTTTGRPGRHLFRTLALYDAACVPQFRAHLFPDNRQMPILSLVPPLAHSSLAYMCKVVGAQFVDRLAPTDRPVCLLGTAFHFLKLFDEGLRLQLPPESRVMETGGFKGRTREVSKTELYEMFQKHFGIPSTHVVNEYGMTELSTQFYDETMRVGRRSDIKLPPRWARVRIIDPHTGEEAAEGRAGLLRIYDLANLWSAMCIQTEDLGMRRGEGFILLGRMPGSTPRGCSLAAEEWNCR
ncbi:MAG: long-chain fatty acid--CoA ligase [Verrucomicrobiae bacterium]|nr:long-chain fatty acid--CoA ligase [Verrucomicrobiae bacterium]